VAHVIVVAFTTTILEADVPPKVTVVVPTAVKSVPVIVTEVPPEGGPLLGATEVMLGAL
jgi:hypothetical protein